MARRSPKTSEASEMASRELIRLNVNLNSETAQALRDIAEERGISFTEAVRRAITVYKYIDDEVQEGRKVQTTDRSNKDVRELVLM